MAVKIGSFEKDGKNFPTIELRADSEKGFGFTFGLGKARLILDNLDEIKRFVESEGKEAKMIFKKILTTLYILECLARAAQINKQREPITINLFCMDLIINAILIYGIWNWL